MEDQLLFKDSNGKDCFIGSVSWGTMHPQDVFTRFYEEMNRRGLLNQDESFYGAIICDAERDSEVWNHESISYLINEEYFDKLGTGLPEGIYFGTLEGDGSDFGYWREQDNG